MLAAITDRGQRSVPGAAHQHRHVLADLLAWVPPTITGRAAIAARGEHHQAEYPARQHVGDLEQYPASQSPPRSACRGSAGQQPNRVFERHRVRCRQHGDMREAPARVRGSLAAATHYL